MVLSNLAALAPSALVAQLLANAALEEALAAFAADGAVMPAAGSVAADYAQLQGQSQSQRAAHVSSEFHLRRKRGLSFGHREL